MTFLRIFYFILRKKQNFYFILAEYRNSHSKPNVNIKPYNIWSVMSNLEFFYVHNLYVHSD